MRFIKFFFCASGSSLPSWIRIQIRITNPGSGSIRGPHWIRIQSGSGSTTLVFTSTNGIKYMTPSSCLCWHRSRGAGSGGSGPPACPWRRECWQFPPRYSAPRWWGRGTASQRGAPRRVSWVACGSPRSWQAAARPSSSCPTWAEFTVEQIRVADPYSYDTDPNRIRI